MGLRRGGNTTICIKAVAGCMSSSPADVRCPQISPSVHQRACNSRHLLQPASLLVACRSADGCLQVERFLQQLPKNLPTTCEHGSAAHATGATVQTLHACIFYMQFFKPGPAYMQGMQQREP